MAKASVPLSVPSSSSSGSAGSALSVGELYREHAATVSRWVRRLLGPDGEVDDLVHEIFLVVQRRLPEFRGDARITTWLYAITVRMAQSRRRRDRWRRWVPGLKPGPLGAIACEAPSPLQVLESRRAVELTYELLDSLAERDRTLLILFELEGLSGEEIAAITGMPLPNVWVQLHRARARFARSFEAREPRDGHGGTT
jgi:RNA polymerase sigma-70 factor, ECF subfamily